MHIVFTNEWRPTQVDEVVDYLRGPRLWIPHQDYPDYDAWTEKVHSQLRSQAKRALVALAGGLVVGAVIYQRHLKHADHLEIKNITVRPDQQGRYIASFLLRNAEIEGGRDFAGIQFCVVDAKAQNVPICRFLLRHRYLPLGKTDLYGLNAGVDIVFRKTLSPLILV